MNANLSSSDQNAINELLRQNKKIEAIKLYREKTGADLKGAKEAVERFSLDGGSAPTPSPVNLSAVVHELRLKGTIAAIKMYRERTPGCGLREAKLFVDELARKEGITPPKAGCVGVLVAILAFATAAALLATS